MRLISRRVDALTMGARVALSVALAETLRSAVELARAVRGPVAVDVGGTRLAITPSRAVDRVHWETGEAHGMLDLGPTRGPNADVVVRQSFLAQHEARESVELAFAYFALFGEAEDVQLRRVDLAADVEGWELRPEDADAWVGPPRGRNVAHLCLEDDGSMRARAWTRGRSVDGFMLCPGAPIVVRCYDKRQQLKVAGSDEARALELACWQTAAVDPDEPVTRLEAQIRSEALRELDARDPRRLVARLDALWQYITQRWCRLILPGTATRRRNAKVDPRWELARSVRWRELVAPAKRVRIRAASTLRQAIGCLRSWAARAGMLSYIADKIEGVDGQGVVEQGLRAIERWSDVDCIDWIRLHVLDLAELLAREGAADLMLLGEPRRIAFGLAAAHDGAVARFARPLGR